MEWYCQYCNTEQGQQCPFRAKQLSDGSVLVTNGGQVGSWYRDEEIDTRPTATYFWKDAQAYACNAPDAESCPFTDDNVMSDEEFSASREEYLRQCRQKDAEDLERIKSECANRTITYDGVTYQSSWELEDMLISHSDEEYLAALKNAKVLRREQPL